MKKLILKIFLIGIALAVVFVGLIIAADKLLFPWIVAKPEVIVPDLTNMPKEEAIQILKSKNLNPVLEKPRYDSRFEKDRVMLQNPIGGKKVKINRRVYLYVSGGDPLVKMPGLMGRTLRDAKIAVERLGLQIDTVLQVRSEFNAGIVVEQIPEEGESVPTNTSVILSVSVGPRVGMILVPNLLGRSLHEVSKLLKRNSLKLGKINYQPSPNLLPNTVIAQYPSEGKLVNYGDSVDVFVTKNVN